MIGWHHRLDGHEFEQAPVMYKEPGMLQSMGWKESDNFGRLNNNNIRLNSKKIKVTREYSFKTKGPQVGD